MADAAGRAALGIEHQEREALGALRRVGPGKCLRMFSPTQLGFDLLLPTFFTSRSPSFKSGRGQRESALRMRLARTADASDSAPAKIAPRRNMDVSIHMNFFLIVPSLTPATSRSRQPAQPVSVACEDCA